MKKQILPAIFAILWVLSACTLNQDHDLESGKDRYVLRGEVEGFEDSTLFYIQANNDILDSAMILDGKFEIKGSVDHPTNVFLITKMGDAYMSFWLEKGLITLKGEKADFRNALATGSVTNLQQQQFGEAIAPIKKKNDSLSTILLSSSFGRIRLSEEEKKKTFALYQQTDQDLTTAYQKFVAEHPDSYMSLQFLDIYKTTWGKKKSEELFAGISGVLKTSSYGQNIQEYLRLAQSLDVGDRFVDFSMTSYQGEEVTLSDIKNKYVLLEFWASWCAPCREENPQLVRTYQRFKDEGFEILGVSLDLDKDAWMEAIQKDGLPWPNVSDLRGDQNKAALMYGVSGIPDNFLIGPDGIIIARNLRGDDLRDKLEAVFSVRN